MYCAKCEAYIPEHSGITACLECGASAHDAKASPSKPGAQLGGISQPKPSSIERAVKKLSFGVVFNAWSCLLSALSTIPLNFNPLFFPGIKGPLLAAIQIFLTLLDAALIASSIFVLKGKERGRSLFAITCVVYLIAGIAYTPLGIRAIQNGAFMPAAQLSIMHDVLLKSYEQLPADSAVRQKMSAEQYAQLVQGIADKTAFVAVLIFWVMCAAYLFFLVWFINRPKVRAQFT